MVGGSLPAATAADMLAVGWDQLAFNAVSSPVAGAVEEVAGGWLKQLLGLPATASVGFGTGAQSANTVGLATGRHRVLEQAGWDVETDGLSGAPRVRVVASVERHATVDRSLRLLGLGTAAVAPVVADPNGAIDTADQGFWADNRMRRRSCACSPATSFSRPATTCEALIGLARDAAANCWVHVDGAFGLWAAACPATRHLVDGVELADSWCTDAHKWLNVPYDSGLVFCADPSAHVRAASYTAAYLVGAGPGGSVPSPSDYVLESSRRAQVSRCGRRCVSWARPASPTWSIAAAGWPAGSPTGWPAVCGSPTTWSSIRCSPTSGPTRTDAVIRAVQRDGTCWLGGTTWRGRRLMRVSVSNWSTTAADVDRSVAAILRLADAR